MQFFVLFIENLFIQFGNPDIDFDIMHISESQLEQLWIDTGYIEWEVH